MKLKIIDCTDPHLWYSNRIGETVDYKGKEDDIYWSRDSGGYVNIVYVKDAVLINDEGIEQMYKYQSEEMMEPGLNLTRHTQFTGQDKVVKASELEKLFHVNDAMCDEIHKCLDQITDRLHPILMQELPSQEKMGSIPSEFTTKLNSQVQSCNERLQAIIRRINNLNDRISL